MLVTPPLTITKCREYGTMSVQPRPFSIGQETLCHSAVTVAFNTLSPPKRAALCFRAGEKWYRLRQFHFVLRDRAPSAGNRIAKGLSPSVTAPPGQREIRWYTEVASTTIPRTVEFRIPEAGLSWLPYPRAAVTWPAEVLTFDTSESIWLDGGCTCDCMLVLRLFPHRAGHQHHQCRAPQDLVRLRVTPRRRVVWLRSICSPSPRSSRCMVPAYKYFRTDIIYRLSIFVFESMIPRLGWRSSG